MEFKLRLTVFTFYPDLSFPASATAQDTSWAEFIDHVLTKEDRSAHLQQNSVYKQVISRVPPQAIKRVCDEKEGALPATDRAGVVCAVGDLCNKKFGLSPYL
jgi:hypothetical protein